MTLADGRLIHILVDSFWKILLPGLTMTIPLTAISFALALCIAVIAAMVQFANVKVLKHVARFYIWVIRGIPLLVQLYIVFYGLPRLGIVIGPFPAAVIVFSINEGAYAAETMRAALESIPAGQLEAGYCVGMSYLQTMRRIVLPQALRTAFPPLSNSLIAMIKDTSLAANITVTEMFMVTQRIVARTYEPLALYIEIGLIYLLFSTVLTKLQRMGEKRMNGRGKQRGITDKGRKRGIKNVITILAFMTAVIGAVMMTGCSGNNLPVASGGIGTVSSQSSDAAAESETEADTQAAASPEIIVTDSLAEENAVDYENTEENTEEQDRDTMPCPATRFAMHRNCKKRSFALSARSAQM